MYFESRRIKIWETKKKKRDKAVQKKKKKKNNSEREERPEVEQLNKLYNY